MDTDIGGFADGGKSVVDEEVAADIHPGVNVDGGQKPREVVHHTGQEIQLPPEKPVSDAVKRKRMNPRIKQDFPAGSRRGIARLHRIKIFHQSIEHGACPLVSAANRSAEHTSELKSLLRISYAAFCLKKKNHQLQIKP